MPITLTNPSTHEEETYLASDEAAQRLGLTMDQFKHRLHRLKIIPIACRHKRALLFHPATLDSNRSTIIRGHAKARNHSAKLQ